MNESLSSEISCYISIIEWKCLYIFINSVVLCELINIELNQLTDILSYIKSSYIQYLLKGIKNIIKDSKIKKHNKDETVLLMLTEIILQLDLVNNEAIILEKLDQHLQNSEYFQTEFLPSKFKHIEMLLTNIHDLTLKYVTYVFHHYITKYVKEFESNHSKTLNDYVIKFEINKYIESNSNIESLYSVLIANNLKFYHNYNIFLNYLIIVLKFEKTLELSANGEEIDVNIKLTKYGKGCKKYIVNSINNIDINNTSEIEQQIEFIKLCLQSENEYIKPKLAKGCVDYHPADLVIRNMILDKIRNIFILYGGEEIDTPIFELKEILFGKYGEDSKLIYELKDQGGEMLALRYDLTVPFARYCGTHSVNKLKRFHIGKVYRRDEPQLAKGRYREFMQADFDIAGEYSVNTSEIEILMLLQHILETFKPILNDYVIKINHRELLYGILELCGIPQSMFSIVCSSIDKLDKESWENIYEELTLIKKVDNTAVDMLKEILQINKKSNVDLDELVKNENLIQIKGVSEAIAQLKTITEYFKYSHIQIELSLARGLDYYTGLIYEAILVTNKMNIGSVASGGRYDNLIGMFSKNKVPSIGLSIGIERIFALTNQRLNSKQQTIGIQEESCDEKNKVIRAITSIAAYIVTLGDVNFWTKTKLAQLLRNNHIPCEYSLKIKTNIKNEINYALNKHIPYMIIIGEEELKQDKYKLKYLNENIETVVDLEALIIAIKKSFNNKNKITEIIFATI